MAMTYEEKWIKVEGIINEDEVKELRDFLQHAAPELVEIDMTACNDVHTAVLQLLVAYQLQYECKFIFGDNATAYQKAIQGCSICENDSH